MNRLEHQFRLQLLALEQERGYARHITEYQFCDRKWRFDFAYPAKMIAIEIEGGVRKMGRHQRPTGFVNDAEKYAEAQVRGWQVLRIPSSWVASRKGIDYVQALLEEKQYVCKTPNLCGKVDGTGPCPSIVNP